MATTMQPNQPPPQPQPNAQGAGAPPSQDPQQGQGTGMEAAASPVMQLLSNWQRVAQEIGEVHPQITAAMQKIALATREALTVLARASQGQQQGLPPDQNAAPQGQPQGQPQPQAQQQG